MRSNYRPDRIIKAAELGAELWLRRAVIPAAIADVVASMPGTGILKSSIKKTARDATTEIHGAAKSSGGGLAGSFEAAAAAARNVGRRETRINIERFLRKFEKIARHSRPGNPPHRQTGNLVRGIVRESGKTVEKRVTKMVAQVGTSVQYGKWLEFGTRKMRARPFLRPSLRRMQTRIKAGQFPIAPYIPKEFGGAK